MAGSQADRDIEKRAAPSPGGRQFLSTGLPPPRLQRHGSVAHRCRCTPGECAADEKETSHQKKKEETLQGSRRKDSFRAGQKRDCFDSYFKAIGRELR
ncbi:hypothetical protein SKAU_G00382340 [Synaphobranchus kaupii]|uniref:Uncharacterized protein n=1 Tax=Synaphobranchus kaupii TaxID=118154 RepID=A0A9Q1EDW6_SYNKA|nr:hypothetical protein SKAU_G00382340 [Synaphobranchus kaupii]